MVKKTLLHLVGAALLCHPVYGLAATTERPAACGEAGSGGGQYALHCAVGAGVGAVALPVAGAILGCAVGVLSKWGMSWFSSAPEAPSQCAIPAGTGASPASMGGAMGKVQ